MGKWKLRLSRCALVILAFVIVAGTASFFVSPELRWGNGALWEINLNHGQLAVSRVEFYAMSISPPSVVYASSPTPKFEPLQFQWQSIRDHEAMEFIYLLYPVGAPMGRAWESGGRRPMAPRPRTLCVSLFYPAVGLALLSIPAIRKMRIGRKKTPAFEVQSRP